MTGASTANLAIVLVDARYNMPQVTQDLDAMVSWMSEAPLRPGQRLAVKHTTRSARAVVKDIQHQLNVNTLHAWKTLVSWD